MEAKMWRGQFLCNNWLSKNEDLSYWKITDVTNVVDLNNIRNHLYR
jgi:hypothetical protein